MNSIPDVASSSGILRLVHKRLLSLFLAVGLAGFVASPATAVSKEGAACKVAGQVVTVAGKNLVCKKVGKKLQWVASTATTTTTTVAVTKTKPVVTLLREKGRSTSPSVNYTITGDKDIDCTNLSTTIGVDFTTKNISAINSIVQTSAKVCTINAQSRAERDNTTYETVLRAATTFAISDTSGNVQTELLGSPQTIWVTRSP